MSEDLARGACRRACQRSIPGECERWLGRQTMDFATIDLTVFHSLDKTRDVLHSPWIVSTHPCYSTLNCGLGMEQAVEVGQLQAK
eukprot:1153840-Pelagomonas_calceolata.AAC.4